MHEYSKSSMPMYKHKLTSLQSCLHGSGINSKQNKTVTSHYGCGQLVETHLPDLEIGIFIFRSDI